MTPEERCERVRMALAEAGYPNARIILDSDGEMICWTGPDQPPDDVWWRACALGDPDGTNCWPCWSGGTDPGDDCGHDPLTSPWPEVVR